MAVNPCDVYVEMELQWRSGIPKELQGMKPRELVTLMRLAVADGGVSQGAAASALRQSQTGMSRITAKLLGRKWVTVARSTDNHKQKLITATTEARLAMDALEGKLAAAMKSGSGSGKRSPVAPGPIQAEGPGTYQSLFGGSRQLSRTRI
jgi:DNA-binding MarR family transcriptional regulator